MKKQTAALLDTPESSKRYHVTVTVPTGTVEMIFTDRAMAQMEYNRIKNSSIYAAQWISTCTFTEEVMPNAVK